MKIKSVSGHSFIVTNLEKTLAFYTKLGFTVKKQESDRATVYLNWYWMEFVVGKPQKESSVTAFLSVDDVDATYAEMRELGIQPDTEPETAHGRRSFFITDPNGYQLGIFARK